MAKSIGTLGNVETLTVGGRTFVNLDNLIRLFTTTSGASVRGTFRKMGSGTASGYTVTSGKSLFIEAVRTVVVPTPNNNVFVALAQVDNDVGLSSGTAFTSPVYFGTETTTASHAITARLTTAITGTPSIIIENSTYGKIASTKYAGAQTEGTEGHNIYIFGYES